LLEPILNPQQRRRDVEDDVVIRDTAQFNDGLQAIDFTVDVAAQFAEPEHAERIADLFQ